MPSAGMGTWARPGTATHLPRTAAVSLACPVHSHPYDGFG
jgi:hypothetical protein